MESDILKKIQKLKLMPKATYCHHLCQEGPMAEAYDSACDYYDRYWKQFLRNELSKIQISKLQQQNMHISQRLQKIYVV